MHRIRRNCFAGFTLIELLIVVAIIAILAAIAVPNFLEAQTRAKTSRAKADLRTLATGLESYRVDNNNYPQCNSVNNSGIRPTDPQTPVYWVLEHLSTPIAYLSTGLLKDPFKTRTRATTIDPTTGDHGVASIGNDDEAESSYKYVALANSGATVARALVNTNVPASSAYSVWSCGPDGTKTGLKDTELLSKTATVAACLANMYDPTNGTISNGDIFRVGGSSPGLGNWGGAFYDAALLVHN